MTARWILALVAVAACAPTTSELARPISTELSARGLPVLQVPEPDAVRSSAPVQELLAQPLSLDAAVRVALLQNRRLAAQVEELGVARAELFAASVPPVEVSATYHLGTIEIDALADVLAVLEIPARRGMAGAELTRARLAAVGHAVRLAAEVELAFGELQAKMAAAELARHHFDAADAAALVLERAHAAGGASELSLARQLEQRETARGLLGRASVEALVAKERLGAALGVSAADGQWSVALAPPQLPPQPPSLDALEREAVIASTELAVGRAHARVLAGRAGASSLRRFLPGIYAGGVAEGDDEGWAFGPALRLTLPIVGERVGAARKDSARLRQAQHELYATAVELRAAARSARVAALGAFAEAAHLRDTVVPLRQRILDETVRHYNAMNADPFAVLAAQQALVEGQRLLVEATARFGAAMARVTALRRGVFLQSMPSSAASSPSEPARAAEPSGGHGLH